MAQSNMTQPVYNPLQYPFLTQTQINELAESSDQLVNQERQLLTRTSGQHNPRAIEYLTPNRDYDPLMKPLYPSQFVQTPINYQINPCLGPSFPTNQFRATDGRLSLPSTSYDYRSPTWTDPTVYRDFFVDREKFPSVIPFKTYRGNSEVKNFLRFFRDLPINQKRLIDKFVKFQIESISEKLSKKHNEELDKIKVSYDQLEKKYLESTKAREENEDLTLTKQTGIFEIWDKKTVYGFLNEDLSECGTFEFESEAETLGCGINERYQKFSNIRLNAFTKKGTIRIRIGDIPGFNKECYSKLSSLQSAEFITLKEYRQNGYSYSLIVAAIHSLKDNVNLEDYNVTSSHLHTVVGEFKKFKQQTTSTQLT